MNIKITRQVADTIIKPGRDYFLLTNILLGIEDVPEKQTAVVRKTVYKLHYIEGHTGKTLWRMRFKYPPGFMGMGKKHGGVAYCLINKFKKNFRIRQ